jgi:hypothetical protein
VWNINNDAETVAFNIVSLGADPNYVRKMVGRIAEDPCTGARTLIQRNGGTAPLRRFQLRVKIEAADGDTAEERYTEFLGLWVNGGPYTLNFPAPISREIDFVFDPDVQWSDRRVHANAYEITVGFAEV